MIEYIQQPWPWYASGAAISGILLLMLFMGKSFGVSSNFETICAMCGIGEKVPYFKIDWRSRVWNLLFLAGAVIGGYIGATWLSTNSGVAIADSTIADMQELGIRAPTGMQPLELFSFETLATWQGWIILVLGGFLIGFGTRYAGGCTSGHAISGLSNLQLPSLVAVIGFFLGGLFTTFVVLPLILS